MTTYLPSEISLISPALLQRVLDVAAAEHRLASEVLRDAIEVYLHDRPDAVSLVSKTRITPDEIVARVFELRKGNVLPEGETIKDVVNFGRA